MSIATTAPPSADVVALASAFDVAARTFGFGIESLFGRWSELRIASARDTSDPLFGVSFATVLDRVIDHRANPVGVPFGVLDVAAETRS
jgi:hypothetical protein